MDLIETIANELRERGTASKYIEDDNEAYEWRRAARAAGRRLGRSVSTMRWSDAVDARLNDWPANDEERARDAAYRAAAGLPA
jgi:hypothetical protein